MKNLKITLKTLLPILLLTLVTFTACKKEHKGKGTDNKCTQKGTVVDLPIGCVGQSGVLGILGENGVYYDIYTDKTGKFSSFKENDPICFDFENADSTNYEKFRCGNGIMEFPTKSIILTCVNKCKECDTTGCKPVKQVESFEYIETGINATNIKQEGNLLKMKISFSGCDDELDPDFLIKEMPSVGAYPAFNCKIKPDQMQMCQAVFTKEVCFDISSILKKYHSATLTLNQSSGIKTFEIKR